jgi:hypothetical protein
MPCSAVGTHCHDAKFMCMAKDLAFFSECATINVPNLESTMTFQGITLQWVIPLIKHIIVFTFDFHIHTFLTYFPSLKGKKVAL